MTSEFRQTRYPAVNSGELATPPGELERQQWQASGRAVAERIALWITRFQELFGENKQTAIAVLAVLAGLLFVAILLAFLTVINSIPFVAALMKLVGFGFTLWLTLRYLIFADTRQELWEKLGQIRAGILGEKA